MDLLFPCRCCLQCLPFFHVSPPSPPRRVAAALSSSSSHSQEPPTGTSSDLLHSALPASQAPDLRREEVDKGDSQDANCIEEDGTVKKSKGNSGSDVVPTSGIDIERRVSPCSYGVSPPDANCVEDGSAEKSEGDLSTVAESDMAHISGSVLESRLSASRYGTSPPDANSVEDGITAGKSEGNSSTATKSDVAPALSGIVIAPPVSANCCNTSPLEDTEEENISATLSEEALQVPFINDVTFAPTGFLPLPSPITPAFFGSGYPAGQYSLHNQIYQGQQPEHELSHNRPENSHYGHEYSPHGPTAQHTNSHHEADHGHDLSHHGHEYSHHGQDHSHHGHDISHHGHDHSHHGHDISHHGHEHDHSHHDHLDDHDSQYCHAHASPHSEVLLLQQPLDDLQGNIELHKEDLTHQSHHHNDDSATALHGAENDDDDDHCVDEMVPTSSLETSTSTPELDTAAKVNCENSAVSHISGASALVESYHSEPIVLFEDLDDDDRKEAHNEVLSHHSVSHAASRRRRREHFKDQLKGIKQQIKQGGHHIKEEGGKHMQIMIENMNKHAQKLEESGTFFIVPRANNN